MKLSDLRPAPGSHKVQKRLGRGHGSGRGKTSGRGTKGQKARTGGKIHRACAGGQTRLSKRLPFLRGLGNSNTRFRKDYAVVNLYDLERFEAGFKPFDPSYRVLFNSYYQGVREMHPPAQPGLIARPALD